MNEMLNSSLSLPPQMTVSDEAQIDAKLKETESAIATLQLQRQNLLRAKASLKGSSTSTQPPVLEVPEKAVEKAMNMLEWKNFKKKDGEWAFMRNRDGSLVEDLQPVVGFVDQLRKGKTIVVGKYRYEASEDKFLSRYFAGN